MTEDLLRQIWPGATLYVLLLTFATVAFRAARELRANEDKIYREFLERVTSIGQIFRRRYLEPVVGRVLDEGFDAATQGAVQFVRTTFEVATYPLDLPATIQVLGQCLTQLMAQAKPAQSFLASQGGSAFMEELDRRQQQRQRMTSSYDALKRHTRSGYLSFLALSIVLFLGLLRLVVQVPSYIVITYINLLGFLLLFGIYSVVSVIRAETALRETFERLALYAEELG